MTSDTTDMAQVFKDRMAKARAAKAAGKAPTSGVVSPATEFLLMNSGKTQISQNAIPDEGAGMTGANGVPGGVVTHTRPIGVTMYKPDGRGGWTPRLNIPASAIGQNIANGWRVHCPDCGGDHDTMDPNDCPAHEPMATTFCPVCGKQIWDNRIPAKQVDHEDDPNAIKLDFVNSSPASRLRATMEVHMWTKHPQQARILGIEPLAQVGETAMDISGV